MDRFAKISEKIATPDLVGEGLRIAGESNSVCEGLSGLRQACQVLERSGASESELRAVKGCIQQAEGLIGRGHDIQRQEQRLEDDVARFAEKIKDFAITWNRSRG